ncbi:hypothetical protein WOC76_16265 [Methylocystis sp. IM3]|jgi:hypothetical protein|uniref:hypothetical protein n=1 Tax=unclassified Methylocystis TaxID=2625913 RepID=UPI0030F9C9FD
MAWVKRVERKQGEGRRQPSEVIAFVKVFDIQDSSPIIQIDTFGSEDRQNPGKQSQTLQFGRESAKQLFDLLKQTYKF